MREMTDRLAAAFSWFGETLKLKEEAAGVPHDLSEQPQAGAEAPAHSVVQDEQAEATESKSCRPSPSDRGRARAAAAAEIPEVEPADVIPEAESADVEPVRTDTAGAPSAEPSAIDAGMSRLSFSRSTPAR